MGVRHTIKTKDECPLYPYRFGRRPRSVKKE